MKGVGEQSTRDANATILRRLKAKEIVDEEASWVCVWWDGGWHSLEDLDSISTDREEIDCTGQAEKGGWEREEQGGCREASNRSLSRAVI